MPERPAHTSATAVRYRETEKAAKKCNQLVLSSEAFFQPIFVWKKLTRLVKNYVAATTRTEATRKPVRRAVGRCGRSAGPRVRDRPRAVCEGGVQKKSTRWLSQQWRPRTMTSTSTAVGPLPHRSSWCSDWSPCVLVICDL